MREYKQFCGIAKALDILGGRWSLLIVRELLPGPRKYSQLLDNLPGITPNLLAERLRALEEAGVLNRASPGGVRAPWQLTEAGRALEPALLVLGAFGAQWMKTPAGHATSGRWFVVSLQRRYTGGLPPFTVALEIDDQPYTLAIDSDSLVSRDGRLDHVDVQIQGPLHAVAPALTRGAPIPTTVTIGGDRRLFRRLKSRLP